MELNDLVRGVGPPAVPDLLDQPLGRYRLAACEQQQSEQRAWLGSAERDLSAAVEDLERPKDSELHSVPVSLKTTVHPADSGSIPALGRNRPQALPRRATLRACHEPVPLAPDARGR